MIQVISHHRELTTLFDRITDVKHPNIRNIHDVLDMIKTGSYPGLKQKVDAVRKAKDKEEKGRLKLQLPAVIWNGKFEHKHKNGCQVYSSFVALDFDHIQPEDMTALKSNLESEPCVYAYFITPSGAGLKAIILHDNYYPGKHTDLYLQLLDKFQLSNPDTSTQDLARGNYLSYDPNLWINPNPSPFHYVPSPDIKEPTPTTSRTIIKTENGETTSIEDDNWISRFLAELDRACKTDETIIRILRSQWTGASISKRGRNVTVLSYAGVLCKAGVKENLAADFIREPIPDLPDLELTRTVKQAYTLNIFGCDRHKYRKRRR